MSHHVRSKNEGVDDGDLDDTPRFFGVLANVTDLEEQRSCWLLGKRIVRGDRK